MDIASWLTDLGLEKYVSAFLDSEIEHGDLTLLTDDDLKELGLPVGPRRRLMKAAEGLRAELVPGDKGFSESEGNDESSPTQLPTEADRRQLTVMFIDLVGSTALSGQMDPEDMRALMRRYQAAVAGAIGMHGGYLANWVGDGAIAYFGWPMAREGQAIEAVRSGLAAVAAVSEISIKDASNEMLAARVGIATGRVVVGDLEQGSIGQHGMVTGETPNLAARLEAVAPPDSVVISQTTRALVEAAFDLKSLGPHELKGISAPVEAWLVQCERAAEGRIALPRSRLTAFTGRTHEVGFLLDRWQQVLDGEGQVVLVSGEAGIGKSRIVQAFRERIDGDTYRRIFYQCSPHHINSALYPAIRQLEHAAGFLDGDLPDVKLDRIEAVLGQAASETGQIMPLIAGLLSIPFEARYGALDIPPQQQRVDTLRALGEQLIGLAREEPVMFVLEDAHWIDPTTRELIVETVPRLTSLPILMLITHRPEWSEPFQSQVHVTALHLAPLSRVQIGAMARDVAGEEVSDEVIARIVERTDGIPLFAEELTKAMAEVEFEFADEDVPFTLQASLMARLDRLGTAKEIAQIGAVVGREFSRELIARVIEWGSDDLDAALDRLVESQLVFHRRGDNGAIYTFKHALVQDVAYESLLRQRRQELHLAIAAVLAAEHSPEGAPELLALHYERGGDLKQALFWFTEASLDASKRSAQPETAAHCSDALRVMKMLDEMDDELRKIELSLLLRQGHAQFGYLGGGSPLTITTFKNSWALAAQIHDNTAQVVSLYGQYIGHMISGQTPQAEETGQQVVDMARETGIDWMDFVGWRMIAGARFLLGTLEAADDALRQALLYGEDTFAQIPPGFAHNPVSTLASLRTHIDWALGRRDEALDRSTLSIEMAAEAGADANALSYALVWDIFLGAFERDPDRLQRSGARLTSHAERTGGAFWGNIGNWATGAAEVLRGNSETGLPMIEAGIEALHATGALQHMPITKISHAEALYINGELPGALALLDESRDVIERTEQRAYEPEMHRWRGIVLEAMGRDAEAVAAFDTAIAVAEGQGSVIWLDRARENRASLRPRS